MHRLLNTTKKWQFYALTLVYILIAVFLEDHPADIILYFSFEIPLIWFFNTVFILARSAGFKQAFQYMMLQLLMLAVVLFFVMFPFTAVLLLNKTALPELNLFYSPKAALLYEFLNSSSRTFTEWLQLPQQLMGFWLIPFVVFIGANEIRKHIKTRFNIKTDVSYEMKYSAFMCLGYLIGFLPAFLLQYIFPNSFPFTLVIIMRFYTEYAFTEKV